MYIGVYTGMKTQISLLFSEVVSASAVHEHCFAVSGACDSAPATWLKFDGVYACHICKCV